MNHDLAMDKAVVISIDALIEDDLEEFRKRRNMGKLLRDCALARKIHCIYPTYTYPCHTTIMTGCYPDKHGVIHNETMDGRWLWLADAIKVPTMHDAAHSKGLVTASICWPVQGGGSADHIIAEIWANGPDDDPEPFFDLADSPSCKAIFDRNRHLLDWMRTPGFDYFASASASDIIREYRPDLTFVHFSYLDHQRHRNGSGTYRNLHAIDFIDERVGEIVKAVEDAGLLEDTTFFILGDHGHMDIDMVFNINKVLAERGYIDTDADGNMRDWRIIAQSCSFSCHVYSRGVDEKEAISVMESIKDEYPEYIERVLNPFEAKEIYHLSGPFSCVLEARDHVVFGSEASGETARRPTEGDCRSSLSAHGFAPEKGPNPPFIVSGKRAAKGRVIEYGRLVDEAPTIMSLFSIDMGSGIDGRAMDLLV